MGKELLRRADVQYFYAYGEDTLTHIEPLGYIDDDPTKKNTKVNDIPVLGSLLDLHEILETAKSSEKPVRGLVIAIAELDAERSEQARDICKEAGIPCYRFGYGFKRLV